MLLTLVFWIALFCIALPYIVGFCWMMYLILGLFCSLINGGK